MYYPFRKEDELKGESGTYGEKLLEPDVIEYIRNNKCICEPFGEIVDEAFVQFNRDARGLDIHGEQENEEVVLKNNDNDDHDEDEEVYHGGAPFQPVQPIISNEELNSRIRSLNKKQREIFDLILKWTRETIQSRSSKNIKKPDPFQIFLTGSAGCGKSHLLTTIKLYLQKSLTYGSKDIGKERLLMLAPTGVAAVNVDGSTIHSTLGILTDYCSGKCVLKLHQEKVANNLRQINGMLSRIRYCLPKDMLKNIYFALFHSKLTYAIQIWGQSLNHNSRLTKLQKSAVRLITFSNFQAASVPIFKELSIPPTYNIVLTLNIKLAHKTLNLESPAAVQEILDLKYMQNSYSTRSTFLKLLARPYVQIHQK